MSGKCESRVLRRFTACLISVIFLVFESVRMRAWMAMAVALLSFFCSSGVSGFSLFVGRGVSGMISFGMPRFLACWLMFGMSAVRWRDARGRLLLAVCRMRLLRRVMCDVCW